MVIMDEPKAKSIYGGVLAAPVFKNVMERSFKFMATRSQLGNASPIDTPAQIQDREEQELMKASYAE
jgi:hypothetical protein